MSMSNLITKVDPQVYLSLEKTCGVIINSIYSVTFENTNYLEPLRRSPLVLLPKHQLFLDILLEGMLLDKYQQRSGFFVMKDSLPSFLDYCGGIRIKREKDLKTKTLSDEQKRKALRDAQEQKKEVHNSMKKVLRHNQVLVIHPEGTRHYKETGEINKSLLQILIKIQKELNLSIPFVPLSINYMGQPYFPRMKVSIDVKKPLYTTSQDTLRQYLLESLPLVK